MGVQFAGNILVQANGGPLPISQGGTGQTTAPTAINALLPTQAGQSGKVLTTDGTNVSWANGGVTAGGSDTQIQFNDSGSLGGLASLVINKSTGALTGTSTFTNAGTNITGAAATYRPVKFQTAGSDRWIMQANNAAETGSAAGSNFEFIRVADNGATTNQVFTVARNSGVVDFKVTPTINGVAIGTGAGTVTSVAVSSANNAISVSGSPITSSGTITVTANTFTSTNPGVVSASGGGTTNFLRADGTWAAPSAASADAGTLTGTTLAANVVNASLKVIQPANTAGGTNGDGITLTGGQSASGNTTGGTVSLVGGTYTGSGSGGGVSLTGGLSATAAGGAITLTGGNSGSTSGTGGAITITGGGVGNGSGSRGGGVTIAGGGTGTGGQAGSDVTISGGQSGSSSNAGGSLILRGGLNANAGGGGPVIISTGGSAYTERLRITGAGAWQLAGSAGTTGQVLTSQGASSAPTWTTVGTGTVTSVAVTSANGAITISGSPITSSGTISVTANNFTTSVAGVVPASGGGTTNFLRADGTWAAPTASATSIYGTGVPTLNTPTVKYVSVGVTSGGLPIIQTTNSSAAVDNRMIFWQHENSGEYACYLTNDAANSFTKWFSLTRSGNTPSVLTLTANSTNLAGLSTGLQLNGSAGTAGQVLTSQGSAAAPTWTTISSTTLSATGTSPRSSATTGLYGGSVSGTPAFTITNASGAAGNKITQFYSGSTGTFSMEFADDTFANQQQFLNVSRVSGTSDAASIAMRAQNLTFTPVAPSATGNGGVVTLAAGAGGSTSGNGGAVSITSGSATTSGAGGAMTITAGSAASAGAGGTVTISAGSAAGSSNGGNVQVNPGAATGTGNGGGLFVASGTGQGGGNGGAVQINSGSASSGTGVGGAWSASSGNGAASGNGGALSLTSGAGGATAGSGGNITVTAGAGNGGNGGSITVTAGGGFAGTGGDISITSGNGNNTRGGNITVTAGLGNTSSGAVGGDILFRTGQTGNNERFRITSTGIWQLAGSAGTTGQYLTANSAGAPTWSSFFSSGNPTIGVGAANLSWYTAGASWRGIDIQNANGENISIVTRASNNQAVYGYNWYQNSSGTLVYTTTNAASRMIYDAPTQSWSFASAPSGTAGTTPTFTTYATIGTTTLTAPSFTSTVATGTAPLTVSSTTVVPNLNVSQLLGSTWVSPGAIGSTTANTGAFTTLTAQSLNTTGSTAPANGVYLPAANSIGISTGSTEGIRIDSSGNLLVQRVGSGLRIKEGTNAKMGVATLVAGTVTVSNTSVTANSRIFLTTQSVGGTAGFLVVSARTAGTSFTILSSSNTDTSVVAWMIVEPA